MNETYKIRTVGGALVVTLPQHVARFTRLVSGDEVTIEAHKNGDITVSPLGSMLSRIHRRMPMPVKKIGTKK